MMRSSIGTRTPPAVRAPAVSSVGRGSGSPTAPSRIVVPAVPAVAIVVVVATRRVVASAIVVSLATEPFIAASTVATTTAFIRTSSSLFLRLVLQFRDLKICELLVTGSPWSWMVKPTNAASLDLYALQVFDGSLTLLDGVILDKPVRRLEGNLG